MSFDAGQFFNTLFNNIGKISPKNEIKQSYNSENTNSAKILPDETPDEKIMISDKVAMYAVPDFPENGIKDPVITVQKYAILKPDIPEPTPTAEPDITVEKYAIVRPDPTEEIPTPSAKPDKPAPLLKYAMPSPEPMPMPSPEPMPAPTQSTFSPAPQPFVPHNTVNPWRTNRINIPQIITQLFANNGLSFAQRVNNAFANFFSRL